MDPRRGAASTAAYKLFSHDCSEYLDILFVLSEPPISFSHAPGYMFICDASVPDYFSSHPPEHGDAVPKVVTIKDEPFTTSLASAAALETIAELESCIQQDAGGRGIGPLCIPGELTRAAAMLSHSSSVAITTGFPVRLVEGQPMDETDGIPGAVAIIKALQAVNISVSIISSHYQHQLLQDVVKYCCETGILTRSPEVIPFKAAGQAASEFLFPSGVGSKPAFDTLVAIEAGGRNKEGKYLSMRALEMPTLQDCCVDELFIQGAFSFIFLEKYVLISRFCWSTFIVMNGCTIKVM